MYKQTIEPFYPRWGWHGGGWGFYRPYHHNMWNGVGNWRPYGYYPAYSGYWRKCPKTGSWCPPYKRCNDPECQ